MVFPVYPHVILATLLLSCIFFFCRADDITSLFNRLKEGIGDREKQLFIVFGISSFAFFTGYLVVFNYLHGVLRVGWGIIASGLVGVFIKLIVNIYLHPYDLVERWWFGAIIGAITGFFLPISSFVTSPEIIKNLIIIGLFGFLGGWIGVITVAIGAAIGGILYGLSRVTTPFFVSSGKFFSPIKHIFQLTSIPDWIFPLVFALVFLASLWVVINSFNACIQHIRHTPKSALSVIILFSICYVLLFSSDIKHFGIFYQNVWLRIFCVIGFFYLSCLILYATKFYGRKLILFLRKKYHIELTFWGTLPYFGFLLAIAISISLFVNFDCYGVETSAFFAIISFVCCFPLFIVTLLPLITPFPYLKWFREKWYARLFWCPDEFMRFKLGNGLPWLVRYSGRWIAREYPAKHKDFKSYFVCRCCGRSDSKEGKKVIGLIGGNIKSYQTNGNDIYVNLWSEREKKARNADIDVLEIQESNGISYDWAINAVLNELKNDVSRPRNYVKGIPVIIRGNPSLSENSKMILQHEFGGIKTNLV